MIGSTFIFETDVNKLLKLNDFDKLNDFTILDLDHMLSLDFGMLLLDSGVKWTEKDPVIYDPDEGKVIAKKLNKH